MSTYGNYQNAYKKASVNTLDQNKLIIMLYDGAIKNATFAVEYMNSGDIEKVHKWILKGASLKMHLALEQLPYFVLFCLPLALMMRS